MANIYYSTFARAGALLYVSGTIIHISRLIFDSPITRMPFLVDWVVLIVGGYAGFGFLVFANTISFKNNWDRLAYALLIFHLLGSVALHMYILIVNDHAILNIFPYWYSYIAVAYFAALGFYFFGLKKRFYHTGK